jgi:oxygen-independent coproporphyrinogen-3 oxidase
MSALGLYIHVPFCPQICPYCAFASVTGRVESHKPYVEALCGEIESWGHLHGPLDTIFFGGGTPSQIEPALIGQILDAARDHLGLGAEVEIAIEVNPGTVDREQFIHLRELGCNRLSIGAQSFRDAGLRLLGRVHSAGDVERAYAAAREAGFANVSLDLIADVPGGAKADWRYSVDRAADLAPEHISVYSLTIEEGTVFAERLRQGRLLPVADDVQAHTFEWTAERLATAGYEHYEVSNYARPGYRSRHNWGYWTGVPYLGVGMGAHSFIDGQRFWNTRDLDAYMAAVSGRESPREGGEKIDADTARREHLWFGLRTIAGVQLNENKVAQVRESARFADLEAAGYAMVEGQSLRLTGPGLLLADALGIELERILEDSEYAAT